MRQYIMVEVHGEGDLTPQQEVREKGRDQGPMIPFEGLPHIT
jgi:hypothetical protein